MRRLLALISVAVPSAVGAGQCQGDEYQKSQIVLDCNGGSGSISFSLEHGKRVSLAMFPAGVRDVSISMSANVDVDISLEDSTIGNCIVGFDCEYDQACATELSYCINFAQMPIYFSGENHAHEKIKISGALTRAVEFAAFSSSDGTGTLSFQYSALDSCPEMLPGCARCNDFIGCASGTAVCDGSPFAHCKVAVDPASTATTTTTHNWIPEIVSGAGAAAIVGAEAIGTIIQMDHKHHHEEKIETWPSMRSRAAAQKMQNKVAPPSWSTTQGLPLLLREARQEIRNVTQREPTPRVVLILGACAIGGLCIALLIVCIICCSSNSKERLAAETRYSRELRYSRDPEAEAPSRARLVDPVTTITPRTVVPVAATFTTPMAAPVIPQMVAMAAPAQQIVTAPAARPVPLIAASVRSNSPSRAGPSTTAYFTPGPYDQDQ